MKTLINYIIGSIMKLTGAVLILLYIVYYVAPISALTLGHFLFSNDYLWLILSVLSILTEISVRFFNNLGRVEQLTRMVESSVFDKYPHYIFREIPWQRYFDARERALTEAMARMFGRSSLPRVIYCRLEKPGKVISAYKAYHYDFDYPGWIFMIRAPWDQPTIGRFVILHEIGHHLRSGSKYNTPSNMNNILAGNALKIATIGIMMLPISMFNLPILCIIIWMYLGEARERGFRAELRELSREIYADGFALNRFSPQNLHVLRKHLVAKLQAIKNTDISTGDDINPLGDNGYVRNWVAVSNCNRLLSGRQLYKWQHEEFGIPMTSIVPVVILYAILAFQRWTMSCTIQIIVISAMVATIALICAFIRSERASNYIDRTAKTKAPPLNEEEEANFKAGIR